MKAGSSSAVAFGRVLQVVRKRLAKTQAEVASSFEPKMSVATVSMAESGNRPPKSEAIVRGYAAALELDDDALVQLWWAMQGMVGIDIWGEELEVLRWWHELGPSPQAEVDHHQARFKASAKWTPDEEWYEPSLELFALAEAICTILKSLLGASWQVRYSAEVGLRDRFEGRLAVIMIEVRAGGSERDSSEGAPGLVVSFPCPEPVARPVPSGPDNKPKTMALAPDVAWILASVEAMPARERAAVAGFIHGLREGGLYSEVSPPLPEQTS